MGARRTRNAKGQGDRNMRSEYDTKTKLQHLTVSGGCEKIARESLDLIERLEHERNCLAKAIGDAAVQIGIIKNGTPLSGPQLLLLMEDIVRGYNSVWDQYQRVMEDIGNC